MYDFCIVIRNALYIVTLLLIYTFKKKIGISVGYKSRKTYNPF